MCQPILPTPAPTAAGFSCRSRMFSCPRGQPARFENTQSCSPAAPGAGCVSSVPRKRRPDQGRRETEAGKLRFWSPVPIENPISVKKE